MADTETGSNGVEASGPWNLRLRITGRQAAVLLLIVGLTVVTGIWVWAWSLSPVESHASLAATIAARIPQSKAEHEAILEALDVQSYVLAECLRPQPNECARIRLRRPRGLDGRLHHDDAPERTKR